MKTKTIIVPLDNFLEIISCADDYWFSDNILFWWFAENIKNLSFEEIEQYSEKIWNLEWYWDESYKQIKNRLLDFKNIYLWKQTQ
jgi:hypothetical protein